MQQSGVWNVHSEGDKSRSWGLVVSQASTISLIQKQSRFDWIVKYPPRPLPQNLTGANSPFLCKSMQSINMRLIKIPIICFRRTTVWMLYEKHFELEESVCLLARSLKPSKPVLIVLHFPCSGLPRVQSCFDQHSQERHLLSHLHRTDINLVFFIANPHHRNICQQYWSQHNLHKQQRVICGGVQFDPIIQAAWWSSSECYEGLTGGLWTGRSRGKTAIIENTTVHSHSSTAGAIHSQQSLHHYGEWRQGERWGQPLPPTQEEDVRLLGRAHIQSARRRRKKTSSSLWWHHH